MQRSQGTHGIATFLVFGLLTLGCAEAMDESPLCAGRCDLLGLSREAALAQRAESELRPFFESAEVGSIAGRPGPRGEEIDLLYAVFRAEPELASIVLVGGRAESMVRYAETLHDLNAAGLTVYALDHRGQGFSDRLLRDPRKGHVGSYDDYVADLARFIDDVVRPGRHDRLYALGHSMGGLIVSLYAADRPDVFDAIVLSSPMFGLVYPPGMSESIAHALAWAAPASWYARPYDDYTAAFAGNELTNSRARYDFTIATVEGWYPGIVVRGPTFGWLARSIEAMRELRRTTVGAPILLLSAGADALVSADDQRAFCRREPDCVLLQLAGARHEALNEVDHRRDQAIHAILDFLSWHF